MKAEAILELYANVVCVNVNKNKAWDKDGNEVLWDESAVKTKQAELEAARDLEMLRVERNLLLAETDWWAMPDTATITDAQKTYRQSLRDITKTYKSMDDDGFSWPTKPS